MLRPTLTSIWRTPSRASSKRPSPPGFLALLNLLLDDENKLSSAHDASLLVQKGSSRVFHLTNGPSKYVCINAMAPANLHTQANERKMKTTNYGMFDHVHIDVQPCPELISAKLVKILNVRNKRDLKVIRLSSSKPGMSVSDAHYLCSSAANKIIGHFLGEGIMPIYTGGKNTRKPLCHYLDNRLLPTSEKDLADLHLVNISKNGLVRLEKMRPDDIGVIYLEDQRDGEALSRYIIKSIFERHTTI